MSRTYLRGDLYYADLGHGIGSEQKGTRPIVIIQNNMGNKHSPTVIIAAITSKANIKAKLPTHYYLNAGNGLAQPSLVEEYPSKAAVAALTEMEHEFLNPKWPGIPRPYWLQLDFWQKADLGIDRDPPPDGIALHPFIALGVEEIFHHVPSTAHDWSRDLERIKTLKLVPTEKNIREWNVSILKSDLRKSKENGSRKIIMESPCKEFPPDPYYFDLHDWSAIRRMPNLTALIIEQICVDDFSFLASCKNVQKLSLRNTNFTDCRLLLGLPKLKSVDLRVCHLTHTEVLEDLQGVSVDL